MSQRSGPGSRAKASCDESVLHPIHPTLEDSRGVFYAGIETGLPSPSSVGALADLWSAVVGADRGLCCSDARSPADATDRWLVWSGCCRIVESRASRSHMPQWCSPLGSRRQEMFVGHNHPPSIPLPPEKSWSRRRLPYFVPQPPVHTTFLWMRARRRACRLFQSCLDGCRFHRQRVAVGRHRRELRAVVRDPQLLEEVVLGDAVGSGHQVVSQAEYAIPPPPAAPAPQRPRPASRSRRRLLPSTPHRPPGQDSNQTACVKPGEVQPGRWTPVGAMLGS